MSESILVTGASGHLGRAIVDQLIQAQGIDPSRIIAGTRDPAKIGDLAGRGVAARRVDFDDASSLAEAFEGVDRLVIVSTDAVGEPGKRLAQHRAAIAAAKQAGVKRIFYTSLPAAETSAVLFAPDHLGSETAIKETGIPYTILRNGWYHENLFMVLPQALASGSWYTSAAQGRTSFVARDDLAAAIAGAVANPPAESATHTLTGPEAFTNDEIAALASEIAGRRINVVHLDDDSLAHGMKAAGVPDFLVPTLISFEKANREGSLSEVNDAVKKLSGRRPQTLRAFLEANRSKLSG